MGTATNYRHKSGCTGKVRYETKKSANEVLKSMETRQLTVGATTLLGQKKLHVYGCPHCDKFHIGSKR